MKLVYVAGPYTADTKSGIEANIQAAEEYGKQIALLGLTPLVPHKNTSLWDLDHRFEHWEHSDWILRICFPLLSKCDAVFMMPGWEASKGSIMERTRALTMGLSICYNLNELEAIR